MEQKIRIFRTEDLYRQIFVVQIHLYINANLQIQLKAAIVWWDEETLKIMFLVDLILYFGVKLAESTNMAKVTTSRTTLLYQITKLDIFEIA